MKKLLITLAILLSSVTAKADDADNPYRLPPPIITLPEGDDSIIPLTKGQPAPFSGQLYSTDTALRWGFWLQQYKYRLDKDITQCHQLEDIELSYQEKKYTILQDQYNSTVSHYNDLLRKSEAARLQAEEDAKNPPFYQTATFGLGLGAVGAFVVTALSIWALSAASE